MLRVLDYIKRRRLNWNDTEVKLMLKALLDKELSKKKAQQDR